MVSIVISFISGSGGAGKTVASSSIGAALAIKGYRVVLVDMCNGLRNLDVAVGLENRVVFDIVDLMENRSNFRQTVISHPEIENLYLIPASLVYTEDRVDFSNFKYLINELRNSFDFILIDFC